MVKSTFVKAWLNGLDISDAVESFRDESDIKKGDLIEMRVKSDKALDLGNHKNMVAGAKIEFQYGFIGLFHSSIRVARVCNIAANFSEKRVQLAIQALDKGIELKKGNTSKVWTNVRLSDIVAQIADKYGLEKVIAKTSEVYSSIPQSGRSDWEFINYLVKRESGSYQFYVSDYALYLEKNPRSKASKRSFTFGENIISFNTQTKEATQKPTVQSLPSMDDKTGQNKVSQPDTTVKDTKEGKLSVADLTKSFFKLDNYSSLNGTVKINSTVNTATANPREKAAIVASTNESNEQKVLTASLVIELDPTLKAGQIITVNVPIEKLSGNWFIEKAVHTIDSNGGVSELSLNKNGTNKPIKNSATVNEGKVNNTEGGKGVQSFKVLTNNAVNNGVVKK